MSVWLTQYIDAAGERSVAATMDGDVPRRVIGIASTYDLAMRAADGGSTLSEVIRQQGLGDAVDLDAAYAERRVLAPIDHPDPAHLHVSGTGLTHLGSAEERDRMHRKPAGQQTDSMRMFLMGVEGGRPDRPGAGVQPEWFYKGDGSCIVGPEAPLVSPAFARDAGEEPEIAGLYVIASDGRPMRIGFALGNEFTDHVTERENYLWLAHAKLRSLSLGGELLAGDLPADIKGVSRIVRDGRILWEKAFLTGEANMSHSIANLEHHHFKYANFRRPGDVHVHFFGTSTLSFTDGVTTQAGDMFEIEADAFARPLRNPIALASEETISVGALER